MWPYLGYGLGALAIAVLLLRRGPSLLRAVQEAEAQQDIQPIRHAVEQLSGKRRSHFFQRSIEILWQKWERELAAQVIQEFATLHPDEKISQYWIRQVLEFEPQTANKAFSSSFLEAHYRPEVAAMCGIASS